MPASELRDLISKLDLTQAAAARFVGVDQRTLKRWLAGGAPVPFSVLMMLRLVNRLELTVEEVETLLEKGEGGRRQETQ